MGIRRLEMFGGVCEQWARLLVFKNKLIYLTTYSTVYTVFRRDTLIANLKKTMRLEPKHCSGSQSDLGRGPGYRSWLRVEFVDMRRHPVPCCCLSNIH